MVSLVEEPTSTDQMEMKTKSCEGKTVEESKNDCQPDSTDKPTGEEVKKPTAAELLAEGRRHLFCNEFAPAVEKLAEACRLHDIQYGDEAVESADAYYYYGESLLELARLEPAVLGNALQGVATEEESSDEEGDEQEETEAKGVADTTTAEPIVTEVVEVAGSEVQFEDPSKLTEVERKEIHEEVEKAFGENADEADRLLSDKADKTAEADTNTKDAESSSPVVEEVADDEMGEGEEVGAEEEEAEVDTTGVEVEEIQDGETDEVKADENSVAEDSNLELAWQMLDLARIRYEKQEGNDFKLKAAQCRLKLGEVSIESADFEKAMEDLNVCLQVRKDLLPSNDRSIAEVYCLMGIAHNFAQNYAGAAAAYSDAKKVLEAKKAQLTTDLEALTDDSAKVKFTRELADLDALIPDLQAKADDAADCAKNAQHDKEALAAAIDPSSTAPNNGISMEQTDVKANDITNLVRKPMKRKSHEADSTGEGEEQLEAKRIKASSCTMKVSTNGNRTQTDNGVTNGKGDVLDSVCEAEAK